MERNGRQVGLQQPHILDNEGVNAHLIQLTAEFHRLIKLIVVQEGVQCNIRFGVKLMRISRQLFDIGKTVGCGGPGAEQRTADIDGVGAVVNGGDAAGEVFGRRQEFNFL
ncbi:hypothetical protein [Desulfobulbus sp.]|uniref:hypothetical protein n=1 Tax=Desulfobulbus sp. TaxID=895 RepID=UPI0027B90283|nr:hypothetical protein [Desulfobulbus sp.]